MAHAIKHCHEIRVSSIPINSLLLVILSSSYKAYFVFVVLVNVIIIVIIICVCVFMGGWVGALAYMGIYKNVEIRGKPQASATFCLRQTLSLAWSFTK